MTMNEGEQRHCDTLSAKVAVLEAVLEERQSAIEKALTAAERAVDKAEKTVTARLEGFPQVYLTRAEALPSLKALESAITEMREKSLDKDYYYREHTSLKESLEKDDDALSDRMARLEVLGSRFAGGLIVVAAIGVANLIKVWGAA